MRGARALSCAIALLLALPGPGLADAPLRPPERLEWQARSSTVVADPALGTTVVSTPGQPDWVIPIWFNSGGLSEDENSFLVIQFGGNLISSNTPETVAFTIYYRNGCAPGVITLGMLPGNGAALPRTVSNHVLYTAFGWDDVAPGWRFTLGDGQEAIIQAQDCPQAR